MGDPSVMAHDLRQGIPFEDGRFDVVYHSHLLEHFSKARAQLFLKECWRVLKPGGTLRVAVPDLERMARDYLQSLERAVEGDESWCHNYDWMMLELYDQAVREQSGGEMAAFLFQESIPNKEFVLSRTGVEAQRIIEGAERARAAEAAAPRPPRGRLFRRLFRLLRDPLSGHETVIRKLLGDEYELLQLGRFRRSGEIHLWMYDRHSLARALCGSGFRNPRRVGPAESRVPNWAGYNLDTEADGTVYKPDSLYMEALK
ncbi:MAG TPA: methyltransferase domain-containing protein [Pyrinomonadaceae bacterium]|nr:methyltransferase domain-containing protein [Pyrinomonadaceae bacterium]